MKRCIASLVAAAEAEGKILIAYFTAAENSGVDAASSASYSMVNGEAVGRLRAIADMIQAETGGELFSIRTSVVYPADGGGCGRLAGRDRLLEEVFCETGSIFKNSDGSLYDGSAAHPDVL